MSDMVIRLWPGWKIVRPLGGGAFGKVYEIHRQIGNNLERAALKVIRIPSGPAELEQLRMSGLGDEDTESYLRRYMEEILGEIGLMQKFVGYSNIVSYEDYLIQKHENDVGWDILIRMELLTPLPEYMMHHSMPEREIIRLGIDISQALIICHGAGIIHRDIKPQNIFVNRRGDFKLGDFGISRPMPGSGSVLSFKGTVPYMAPETFSMRGTDVRSDIYSLALVLYKLLNGGREPFLASSGFTPAELENAQRKRLAGNPLPRPAEGSSALWGVLSIALSADPSKRYQTAGDFNADLKRLAAGQQTIGYRPDGTYTLWEDENKTSRTGEKMVIHTKDKTVPYVSSGENDVNRARTENVDRTIRKGFSSRYLLTGILGGLAIILIISLFALTVPSLINAFKRESGSESSKEKTESDSQITEQSGTLIAEEETAGQQELSKEEEATDEGKGSGYQPESDEIREEDVDMNSSSGDEQLSEQEASGSDSEAEVDEDALLPTAVFVEYVVYYQDSDGIVLGSMTDTGIEGNTITLSAKEYEGFKPRKQTETLYLSGDEEENVVTFIYDRAFIIPDGALRYNGHSYYAFVSSEITSFWEAVAYCESQGGYMAVINTDEENRALYEYVFDHLDYQSAYFGYTDDGSEKSWYWAGGDSSSFENWKNGQPDNLKHGDKFENYALFYYTDPRYKWNDGDFGPDPNGNVIFLIEWDS